jgi:hypothetical protein
MIRDSEIAALRTDLEQIGIVVAPHRDHLCVRLPLFASVRVRIDDKGRLDCQPMFGPLPRTPAMLLGTLSLMAVAGALFYFTGPSPIALMAGLFSVMAGIGSAWRLILTENCITRIQLVWARLRDRESMAALSSHRPYLEAVEAPPPELASAQRITAERKR